MRTLDLRNQLFGPARLYVLMRVATIAATIMMLLIVVALLAGIWL